MTGEIMIGQTISHYRILSFVQQQKLDDEQLQTLAFLQTKAGNSSAAQQSLQRYAAIPGLRSGQLKSIKPTPK